MVTGPDTEHECALLGEENCQACAFNAQERAGLNRLLESNGSGLAVGFYHPSESFRRMGEHVCVMDTSRNPCGCGGELIALFGPSRCAGATEEEEAQSEGQARLFIASVRMLAALNRVLSAFEFTDRRGVLYDMPAAIADARRAVAEATGLITQTEAA